MRHEEMWGLNIHLSIAKMKCYLKACIVEDRPDGAMSAAYSFVCSHSSALSPLDTWTNGRFSPTPME